ncbi:MAG: Rne/Rng family ribonuclease [Rhodospirillales bacterium]
MPTKRMLIDASHPEETRVVVVDGTRLEDYDVEVASRRQLKGNIYLAKITRVEPSLQAAFVDYGGNRHGFLAFSEIHPDYYQIPVADRERLLAEEAALRDAELAEASEAEAKAAEAEAVAAAAAAAEGESEDAETVAGADGEVQEVGGSDDEDEIERRPQRQPHRGYKIQEVIKRRQIMLVQVAKEERGSKGAALTTYLSLAGRYCVLMPNTVRGGGISRKIGNIADRKRLKKILAELDVPDGMAVIVRTAGLGRSKAEIKRDYDYMMRLWSNIREETLKSTAPALVYEEGNLIKRSLRDLYERDIEEILIQGEPEYKVAREFMKLFIPSHAKRVKQFADGMQPLFQAYHIEDQLDAMHQPVVQLRSGGYIVLNATEALISIDVNSGRSTRERHIEETALRTNLEAADEVARQLRLRDLAGLIVIDFIDMENTRNQGLVERRVKEAMKGDRARTQIGRISPFGLLELSRQRLRPSLLETSFEQCPHCQGMGVRRTTESTALTVLRRLEEEGQKQRAKEIFVTLQPVVAAYLLNQKRRSLATIEERFELSVSIIGDPLLNSPEYRIERGRVGPGRTDDEVAEVAEETEEAVARPVARPAEREEGGKRGRRRRGRRRRRDDEQPLAVDASEGAAEDETGSEEADEGAVADEDEDVGAEEAINEEAEPAFAEADPDGASEPGRKRRRRGKRGGRRRSRRPAEEGLVAETVVVDEAGAAEGVANEAIDDETVSGDGDDLGEPIAEEEAEISAEFFTGTAPEGDGDDHAEDDGEAAADAGENDAPDMDEATDAADPVEAAERVRPKRARRRRHAEEPEADAASAEPVGDAVAESAAADEGGETAAVTEPTESIEIVHIREAVDLVESEPAPAEETVARQTDSAEDAEPGADDAGAAAEENPSRSEDLVTADADDGSVGKANGSDSEPAGSDLPVQVFEHEAYAVGREPGENGGGEDKESERPRRGWWQRLVT